MLIEREEMRTDPKMNPGFPTPVVGSVNDNVPTSADVHLYADPGTITTRSPVLYADCEGLEGGGTDPVALRANNHKGNTVDGAKRNKPKHINARTLSFGTGTEKSKREYAVTELYPRLLYTFSDVVVFVLRNSKYVVNYASVKQY